MSSLRLGMGLCERGKGVDGVRAGEFAGHVHAIQIHAIHNRRKVEASVNNLLRRYR